MKDFLKYTLATVVGMLVVGLIFTIITVISLVGMTSSTGSTSVPDDALLVIKLEGQLQERSEENPLAQLFGNSALASQGLDDMLRAIRNAKENDKVKGIYLEAGTFGGAAPAMLEELRQALVDFKSTRKPIVAYGDTYTQGAYYLCSVADSIIINPQGMLNWCGLSTQTAYFKDLLDKLGVEMQIFKVGTYKSAVEPYFLNEMSEANREQILTFSTEIWNQMVADVAKSRHLTTDKLNALADQGMLLSDAKTYKKSGLVDKIAYSDEVPQIIANTLKMGSREDYTTISVEHLASSTAKQPKGTSGKIIAVYYATGTIVDEATGGFTSDDQIVSKTVIRDLKELADDDDVKAVVLRVNSPGGSAFASEQIWHQVCNIKAKKPIIVSMGSYAASGGYYISCAADWIVAEPTTLTGSIGIFGTVPVADKLLNDKLGIHFQTVKTNQMADFGDISREMNESEKLAMQTYVNRGYELFTKRCADGRKMKQDDIKKIAEGRVWTGIHAKQIGLVDQLGSLDDAIALAKKKGKAEEATVLSYPAKASIFENLLTQMSGDSYADAKLKATLGEYYNFFGILQGLNRQGSLQTELPYYLIFNL